MANIYLEVRDSDGVCINAIEWDGVAPYTPTAGTTLMAWDAEIRPWIGWQLVDGAWAEPQESQEP